VIGRLVLAMCGWLACSGAMAVSIEDGDAGFSYQFRALPSSFVLVNDTDHEIQQLAIKPARPADRIVTSVPEKLAPRERLKVDVELHTEDDFGARMHMFVVTSSDSEKPSLARVRVYGLSVLQDAQRTLDFGAVDAGEAPKLEYAVQADDATVRIKSVKAVPAFVSAQIADDGRRLILTHSTTSAWGRLEGIVKVALDSRDQQEAWIPVVSEVRGQVRPSSTLFSLGLARIGSENEFILQYRHTEEKPFRLDKMALEGIAVKKTSIANCVGNEKGCQQIRFAIDDAKQPTGQLKGLLRVHLSDPDREIFVLVGGMLVGKDTKIESLELAMAASKNAQAQQENLGLALKKLTSADSERPVEPEAPKGDGPLLRWSVDNDGVVYGYAIYRSEKADGPFELQPRLVRRSITAQEGRPSMYAVRDTTAVKGKDYWYRIATFYPNGKREFLTAAQHVKAGGN
jgi:hypothetical protein